MEHRWGERFAVRMTVELSSGSAPAVTGCLENVSASGAFVRTDERGPPRGPVVVILRTEVAASVRSVRLAAHVVREDDSGVGIEWCQFAPRAVRELMVRDRDAGADRARARSARTVRRPAREPDTVMPARAQLAGPTAFRTRT